MKYDFDKITDRHNTNSVKWDLGEKDIIPMWVADMDFQVSKPVKDALMKVVEHGVFGYSFCQDKYYDAIINWQKNRNQWNVSKDWIIYSPGIVPAVNILIRALTQTGDKVIVQTPVYYPFFKAINNNGCQIEKNPLKYEDGKYLMDFEDLENKAKDPRVKLLILCSPHNPVGRVWTKDELTKLGKICLDNDVLVISDEIHSDLIYKGNKHTPFASISEEFSKNSITCMAPSKTFNLAGIQVSSIIIPNYKIRKLVTTALENDNLNMPNIFAIASFEAAYNYGEEWLEQLLEYLEGNLNFLIKFVEEKLPMVDVIKPEGTYLVWMDFRKITKDQNVLEDLMLKKAKVWLDEGYIFGDEGIGFERINIACPRSVLEDALNKIALLGNL
ncbi:MAG: MalY/PatB family protein [Clostridiaceae bacterium]